MSQDDDHLTEDRDGADATDDATGRASPADAAAEVLDAAADTDSADDTDDADDDADAEQDGDEDIERLYTKADVTAIEAAAQDRHLRLLAEYDNFRRRTAREKERWSAEGIESLVRDLLPVFDSFDKARTTQTDDAATVLQGLDVTYKQLRSALDKHDIEVIDPVGEVFDPRWHEALMRRPAEEGVAPGTVVEVFERGYRIGPVLIRAARTVVASEE